MFTPAVHFLGQLSAVSNGEMNIPMFDDFGVPLNDDIDFVDLKCTRDTPIGAVKRSLCIGICFQ